MVDDELARRYMVLYLDGVRTNRPELYRMIWDETVKVLEKTPEGKKVIEAYKKLPDLFGEYLTKTGKERIHYAADVYHRYAGVNPDIFFNQVDEGNPTY